MSLDAMMSGAFASARVGDVFEAARVSRAVLEADAGHVGALRLLATLSAREGRIDEAVALLDRAVAAHPEAAEPHVDKASFLSATGRFGDAIDAANRAIALASDRPEWFVVRGVALHSLGRLEEALADYDRALALRPAFAGVLANRGAALKDLERYDEALEAYERALAIDPGQPEALTNRGAVLVELGRFDEALASCDAAVARMPRFHEAWHNRGVALVGLKRYGDAIASYSNALAVKPDFAQSLQSRGSALGYLKMFEPALADFSAALALDPDLPFLRGNVLHSRLHCGVWQGYAEAAARLVEDVRAGKRACEPLSMVAIGSEAADQLACSVTWMERHYPDVHSPLARGVRYGHDRIRIAYLSADFHEHATAYLMAELFERHDRSRFDVTAVSWGPDVPSAMRTRLVAAFGRFEDVRERSDEEIARWMREREIDIAVDLKGYTFDARLGILAHRPAPVQATYIGFPGTLGAPYVDYLVADETVIPVEDRALYTEKIVYLPECYQPNDRRREIASRTPTRAELGLPESGFVFASFNNSYKVTPEVFEVWMRLLRDVDGSVLWLLEGNDAVPASFRREAQSRAVAPGRLVFAKRMPLPEHLARHRAADLFLDTLPCNAHTTASDSLWAGLPVLTCAGRTFAGRVAASLVRAAGLPDLVTGSLDEYADVALRLAREPAALREVRERLERNRATCPLFDAERSCKALERAFETMWERNEAGLAPAHFAVEA